MEVAATEKPPSFPPARKRMTTQITIKRDETPLHYAVRCKDLAVVKEILTTTEENELKELLSKQNQSGETALYIATENGYVDLVKEMINYYDLSDAGIKARNGFDAFHIAAKQGDLEILKVLLAVHPELAMTVDLSNTTALHTAATQGHIEIVNFLLEVGSGLATIARSNGKTALHSAARNGHVEVVKALLGNEPGIAPRTDKKGQTALHMAVKGQNLKVVEELISVDPSLMTNMVDTKGNTPLHIAARKGRIQIVKLLLGHKETNTKAVNKSRETALDTAEKTGNPEVTTILQQHGVQSARNIKPVALNPARELKQTVSDIKHEVHNQLEHTRQTRKNVHDIVKRLHKMHSEGLNNTMNSTNVVAVLIASVAFAAIFTLPGQFIDNPNQVPKGHSLGESNIAIYPAFVIFFIFDSLALFISLAIVVVQTSVVVIESKAKKKMAAVINKLLWLACVLVTVAFLALSYIIVGQRWYWLASGISIVGAILMVATLAGMCYWVIRYRLKATNMKNTRRSPTASRSRSAIMSDSEIINNKFQMYAL
ncbi:ankyrin repeat-containing protein At5g02620 [Gossypium raimondii]|uniref:PGG domain-containing protein n=1 Tax=Gossypium raimondii TaxID=29730 RepID=A0A0D2QKD0_GOSRA|nr:ankyrin repeat-containing protein At5g02620 [Gossypium raimondii]KJB20194.1 hypothetical protein B456_003G137600 [Gossypium raimondii]MBA0582621.1 hypothetical protein [Gossypium raimondii]